MYGRGNYAPQVGSGPQTPMPPFQQRPSAPPPPPPPFQQRPLAPPHSIIQHSAPSIPPHVGQPYPTGPLNSQWNRNVHHFAPPVPPFGQPSGGPSHPQMFRPLQPPRLPPPPPPPTSSLFTPSTFGTFVHIAHQDPHTPATLPPPPPLLPYSPTPPPPSPPPVNLSSLPVLTTVDLSYNSESRPSFSGRAGFEGMSSDSVDKVLVPQKIEDDALEGGKSVEAGPPADGLSALISTKVDLPPPPPKPAEEKVVRNIEVLCQFIAKNGPGFEDMARQKEFGNPEYEFLFGGERGTKAAISHEYFVWMKKKCSGEHGQNDSPSRNLEILSSVQPDCLMDHADVSHSPSDSDMEMEDDITQPDEQRAYNSLEGPTLESVLTPNQLEVKDHAHAGLNTSEHSSAKGSVSCNLPWYGSSPSPEQGKGSILVSNDGHSTFGQSFSKIDRSVMNFAGERPLRSNVENTSIPPQQDLGLQVYASDDSSENDHEPSVEIVSPARTSPSIAAGVSSSHRDTVSDLPTDLGLKSLPTSEIDFGSFSESVVVCSPSMPSKALGFYLESERTSKETDITSIVTGRTEEQVENNHINQESAKNAASHKAFQTKDGLGGGNSKKEDVRGTSTMVKVDEFGRLVRESASDSDSGDFRYRGKRSKRGRSWSRSLSPHDRRRRSPRRRKEKRSRSRSWSPNRRRSRSKSPSFRRGGEFGSDRMRRDKGQLPQCFDFLKGKCYRGASCRYVHHDVAKTDGSRRHRSKHWDPPHSLRGSAFLEEVHIISDRDGKPLGTDVARSESSGQSTAQGQGKLDIEEQLMGPTIDLPDHGSTEMVETFQATDIAPAFPVTDADADALKSPCDSSSVLPASMGNLEISQPLSSPSVSVLQNADYQPQQMGSVSSHVPTSAIQNRLSISEPHSDKISSILSYPDFASVENPPPSQAPFPNQHSHFSVPPNSAWTFLSPPPPPQPPPPPPPPRNDFFSQTFMRPYPTAPPAFSQVHTLEHQIHPPVHEPHRPPFHMDHFRPQTLAMSNPVSLPFGGPGFVAEHSFTRLPIQGLNALNSNYFNPYASTFDRPLTSQFSSNVLRQEIVSPKYDAPFSMSHVSADGYGVGSIGSRLVTSSPNSSQAAEHGIHGSGGGQYDPLFDSIHPSSNLSRNFDHGQRPEAKVLGGSDKQLDVEENNKQKVVGAVGVTASVENENDEVGAVENASPSNSLDVENTAAGEIEIDQVKTPGKSQKSKHSRSMKLFKNSVASFVKEVLKPSWRQGNMSKEAFKTIVKKTVDKVSGAMKSHQIPKSQAKINQYIESSEQKLTKLVMGYVDKYVNG